VLPRGTVGARDKRMEGRHPRGDHQLGLLQRIRPEQTRPQKSSLPRAMPRPTSATFLRCPCSPEGSRGSPERRCVGDIALKHQIDEPMAGDGLDGDTMLQAVCAGLDHLPCRSLLGRVNAYPEVPPVPSLDGTTCPVAAATRRRCGQASPRHLPPARVMTCVSERESTGSRRRSGR
jgi:hypothetical protein